ncbi:hypothetical protein J5N97_029447 [Dioscorea zingiberensis]|uniref:K Homology domain-containing protein n=1 Tax=Dioscorea zingiberensis TaxID=325984 RepID=A0A9D5C0Q2_9LILI|nr:hypothetical protein J5N97_029447 [Dioscorea zingiberensis]
MSAHSVENSEDGFSSASDAALEAEVAPSVAVERWPGWPGDSVFRLVIPVVKVGSVIGRGGRSIRKLCKETRARVRILDGPASSPDRIVLISAREEPDAELSPAMDAVIRVVRRANGLPKNYGDGTTPESSGSVVSIRFLIPSAQGTSLIGKRGTLIKSIQEGSGASVRVLSRDELPIYSTMDERVLEIQGKPSEALKALEAVLGHLRKFLVDHSIIPLFERNNQVPQDHAVSAWGDNTQSFTHNVHHTGINYAYPPVLRQDSLHVDHEPPQDSQYQHSGLALHGPDPSHSSRSSGFLRSAGAIVTQVTQTMQIPLFYAERIIGIGGQNIEYIRHTSGAILSLNESASIPDNITIEIKGTVTQVQAAHRLIRESTEGQREPVFSGYGSQETRWHPSAYSRSAETAGYGSYDTRLHSSTYSHHAENTGYGRHDARLHSSIHSHPTEITDHERHDTRLHPPTYSHPPEHAGYGSHGQSHSGYDASRFGGYGGHRF